MAKVTFNIAEAGELNDTAPEMLPVGDYTMQITQSDLRDTKAGDGQYIWLELEILGPKYAGRRYWERLNLFNKNDTAVRIAKKTLGSICKAVGIAEFQDTDQLHFKPMKVAITHKENKQGKLETRADYYSLSAQPQASASASTPAPAAPAAGAPKPWERHKK